MNIEANEKVKSNNLPSIKDFDEIHELISGRAYAAAIYVAAKLNIADLLKDKAKTAIQIAEELNSDPKATYRLLRALASKNIFTENDDGEFELTRLASTLRTDIPNSMRDLAIMCGSDWHWQTWGGLLYSTKNGKPYFPVFFNKDFFSFIKENTEAEKEFNNGMSSLSSINNYAIADKYDFSDAKQIIDVGGGHGGLLQAILKFTSHNTKGLLYDLPSVTEAVKNIWKNDPINQRITIKSGDFFKEVPLGGDVYIVKHVLHGLDDEQSINLLTMIKTAMPQSGKLLIIEMLIPAGNVESFSKFNDLGMMLLSSYGQEREQKQFENIIGKVGLLITRIIPVHFGVCIIETIKK
jgi:phospholipid N-methyltransferase